MSQTEFRLSFLDGDGEYIKGTPPCVYCPECLFDECDQGGEDCALFEHYIATKIRCRMFNKLKKGKD